MPNEPTPAPAPEPTPAPAPAPPEPAGNPDKSAEYLADAKKYRGRAQEAEAKLAEIEKAQEAQRTADLEAKGQWDTLKTEMEQKIDTLTSKASEWDTYQQTKRTALVEKLPEDKREVYSDLPLDKLENLVQDLTTIKPGTVPVNTAGAPQPEMGGFTSLEEWATKDPKGYTAWRATQQGGGAIAFGWNEAKR